MYRCRLSTLRRHILVFRMIVLICEHCIDAFEKFVRRKIIITIIISEILNRHDPFGTDNTLNNTLHALKYCFMFSCFSGDVYRCCS